MLKTKDTNPNHNFSTLVDWWDHLVQTGPDMPALEYGEKTISRRSLNNQAEQIAARLTAEGLTSGALVGIAVNRSLEMVAGLLGILKAGCAYVPMDVNYPEDRLKWMLEDADLSVVLTQTELIQKLPQSVNTAYWTLDNMPDPAGSFEPVQIVPSQPAYVIYTSGSTGRPKGVMIAHQSVVNLIAGQLDLCPEPTERFLFAYSFAFDGSVLLFFWAL